jgi:hypothetical protein
MQVAGKGATSLERLGSAVRGDTAPMLLSAHIDAGGLGMEEGHGLGSGRILLAFFRHTFLQSGAGGRAREDRMPLRKDILGGGVLRAARLLHLE